MRCGAVAVVMASPLFLLRRVLGRSSRAKDDMGEKKKEGERRIVHQYFEDDSSAFYFCATFFFMALLMSGSHFFLITEIYIEFYLNEFHQYT